MEYQHFEVIVRLPLFMALAYFKKSRIHQTVDFSITLIGSDLATLPLLIYVLLPTL